MIHETAIIDPLAYVSGASVGARSIVGRFSSVTDGTIIGDDCLIWPLVNLCGPRIGNRCKIASGVVMGGGFEIGNEVFLGPNVVLANDMWPEVNTDGWDKRSIQAGRVCVRIEDGAAVGSNSVILPGVTIGAGAVVAAGSVVTKHVPANMLWLQNGYTCPVRPDRREKRMRYVDKGQMAAFRQAIAEGMLDSGAWNGA